MDMLFQRHKSQQTEMEQLYESDATLMWTYLNVGKCKDEKFPIKQEAVNASDAFTDGSLHLPAPHCVCKVE